MDNSVQMKTLLFIDLNDDVMGCADVLQLLSLFFFFLPMSGYVLNVVISNEKRLKNAYFPKKKKVDFLITDFSPLMFVL